MGIIYQFAIRFIKVKDISKVDKRCVKCEDDDFEDYLIKAKENCATKLKEVSLSPNSKRSYIVENILIPEGTEVITFGNNACDRRGGCTYEVHIHYHDTKENYSEYVGSADERNRFMIIPKTNKFHPIRMDYTIGYDACNTYTEENCIVKIF